MSKFSPLRDRVMLSIISPDRTPGGIIIPDTARDQQTAMARVVEIGPGVCQESGELAPMDTKVGDLVLFMRYSGVEVSIKGKPFTLIRDHEVLGVFEE